MIVISTINIKRKSFMDRKKRKIVKVGYLAANNETVSRPHSKDARVLQIGVAVEPQCA